MKHTYDITIQYSILVLPFMQDNQTEQPTEELLAPDANWDDALNAVNSEVNDGAHVLPLHKPEHPSSPSPLPPTEGILPANAGKERYIMRRDCGMQILP